MKAWTVVGYTYAADIYCTECVLKVYTGDENEWALDTEDRLDQYAETLGIDRQDEWTFDSGDFPKVVFADQDEGDHCGLCHEALID